MMAKQYNDMLKNPLSTDSIWESCVYDILNAKYDKPWKDFFESNLLSFNKHLDADYVCVERFTPNREVMEVVCACNRTNYLPPSFFHNLSTSRERILLENTITVKENVCDIYPTNQVLSDLKIEAYSSVVLFDSEDKPIGILTALFCDEIKDVKKTEALMFIFSRSTGKDLECATEQKLHKLKNSQLLIYKEELERTKKQLDKINEQLKIANIKAKESQQLKTSFLANLSHEIRTPMNAILGFTELLRSNGIVEEERNEYLDIVLQNGGQLLRVMDDLIEVSKLQTEQGFNEKERVSVNDMIMDLQKNYTHKINVMQKPLKLVLILGNQAGKDSLITHKEALYKILDQLIDNAVKFTKKGFIYIGYTAQKGVFEFFVKDSGIGIPSGKEERIFDLFRQINNSMNRDFGGNGVGLSIAKKYVESMGGQIWAEPNQQEGALFKFTIPAG